MLQNLRTARHRAERQGELRWERADERSLEEVFEALLRLHRARWAARGEPGVLASGAVQAAHRASLPGLLRSGVLRLHALRLDGAIIAALYALADRPGGGDRRVYYEICARVRQHGRTPGLSPAFRPLSTAKGVGCALRRSTGCGADRLAPHHAAEACSRVTVRRSL
jgi:hypothetical protein